MLSDGTMPVNLDGKVYKTVVRPPMLYGADTWATTRGQEERLEVDEMKMLRWIRSEMNTVIRETTRVVQVAKTTTEKRLKWYGPRPLRPPNKTPALAQEWAAWSKHEAM